MTRMQIIAKAVLSALGLHVALTLAANTKNLLHMAFYRAPYDPPFLLGVVCLGGYTALIAIILICFLFYNNRPARWLAGNGQILSPAQHRRTLITSCRLILLLLGLFLLPDAVKTIEGLIFLLWPPTIRATFNWLLTASLGEVAESCLALLYSHLADWLKAAAAVYLILGAPQFIRWHINYSMRRCAPFVREESL